MNKFGQLSLSALDFHVESPLTRSPFSNRRFTAVSPITVATLNLAGLFTLHPADLEEEAHIRFATWGIRPVNGA